MDVYEKYDDKVKWKLLQYVSPAGRPAVDDWRNDLSSANQADFDVFMRNMVKKSKWVHPEIGGLSGKHLKGFRELRWRGSDGVPHRIGGYFASDTEFAMLIGWTHNKKKYDPPSAFETLIDRKKKLDKKEATLCEFKVITGR